ncbi:MAG: hypothetical protein GY797_00665 [Deltaproteobacteria bacterium]|nr:hypothetical protein [Deltaproteobacteria bacterium]
MNTLKQILSDIRRGENIDLFVTIAVSIVVGIIGLLGFATDQIFPLTLAVLALLAFTNLKSRYQVEQLINKFDETSAATISLDEVFQETPPVLQDRLRKAKSIFHNGITLVGTSNALLNVFSNCLDNDGQVRLLMVDPESTALEVAVQRFSKHQDHHLLKREAEHALDNFRSLLNPPQPNFQINLFGAVPAYSIWLIDAGTPAAEIWVGLYSFRDQIEPWLHLLPQKDKDMFDFFNRQLETMWQSSNQWSAHQKSTQQ